MSGIIMSCEIVHKDTIYFLYIAIVERRTDLAFAPYNKILFAERITDSRRV